MLRSLLCLIRISMSYEHHGGVLDWFLTLIAVIIILPIVIILYNYATAFFIAKLKSNSTFKAVMSILSPIGMIIVIGTIIGLAIAVIRMIRGRNE